VYSGRMEGSSKPENKPPGSGMMRFSRSDHMEKQQRHTDSFLTAARLLRGGWLKEGKTTKCQRSYYDNSAGQLSHPRTTRFIVLNSRNRAEDKKEGSEKHTDEANTDGDNTFSAKRLGERQAHQTGVVCVWSSGCQITCTRPQRLKAPFLPAIAEM